MENKLKMIAIICICIVVGFGIYSMYLQNILPKKYNELSTGVVIKDQTEYKLCNDAVAKYIKYVKEDINNITYFMPSGNINSQKANNYMTNLNSFINLKTYNAYKINNNTYKIEYTIFQNREKKYAIIIKFNENRNYYTVLYDELYEKGMGVTSNG